MAATDLLGAPPRRRRESRSTTCSRGISAAAPATSRSSTRSSTRRARHVNLARTLLYAAERTPDAEALVDGDLRVTYAELRARAARLAARPRGAGRRARRPSGRDRAQPARVGRALLGLPVARRRVRAALPSRLAGRTSTTASPTPARASCSRPTRTGAAARRCRAPGRSRPRRTRARDHALHVGHDRPPEGRAALPPRRPRRRALPGAPARLRLRRPHPRRDAALPHDGRPTR